MDETLHLTSCWTGWLWACGIAACRRHWNNPVATQAAAALGARRPHLTRAARLLAGAAGRGVECAAGLDRAATDLIDSGPWGDDEGEVRSLAEACANRPGVRFGDDRDRLHRALVGSLEQLCAEVFRLRTLAWAAGGARVARTPIGRLQLVGVLGGWIARPEWRRATGPDAVRRALKRIVDEPSVLEHLDEGGAAAGLERCVVEVHNWLRTGELGQPWMSDWTASY